MRETAPEDARNSFVAATRPWAFTDGAGRRHEATRLGYESALYWLDVFTWAGTDPWRLRTTSRRFIRALYPPRLRYWCTIRTRRGVLVGLLVLVGVLALEGRTAWFAHIVGWPLAVFADVLAALLISYCWIGPGIVDPVAEFLKLDGPTQSAAITDFFLHAGLRAAVPPIPPRRSASRTSVGASPPRPKALSTSGG